VADHPKRAPRGDGRILLSQRPGRAVARICERRLAVLDQARVQAGEVCDHEEDLAADFEDLGDRESLCRGECLGDVVDGASIERDVLADAAVTSPSGARYVVARLDGVDGKALQDAAAGLVAALGDPAAVLLASAGEGGAVMVAAASPGAVAAGVSAGKFVGGIAKRGGGGGGGRPNLAQAGGKDAAALPAALEEAERQLAAALK
jgi:alanyl-tRNA synthetase